MSKRLKESEASNASEASKSSQASYASIASPPDFTLPKISFRGSEKRPQAHRGPFWDPPLKFWGAPEPTDFIIPKINLRGSEKRPEAPRGPFRGPSNLGEPREKRNHFVGPLGENQLISSMSLLGARARS